MSAIPPTNLSVNTASLQQAPSVSPLLNRLAQAVRVRGGDSVDVSTVDQRMESLRTRLAEASSLVERAARSEGTDFGSVQAELDAILADVNRTAESTGLYDLRDIAPSIAGLNISNSTLAAGETVDVELVVLQSAHRGGLLLSFGDASLDLGSAHSSFTIEVGGANGAQELSFASGTSITAIADAISSFADQTGVRAELNESHTAIRLKTDFGSDEFVSVDIIDDGGIFSTRDIGVYRPQVGNKNFIDADSRVEFGAVDDPIVNSGQTLEALVNGQAVTGDGPTLSVSFEKFDAVITFPSDPFRSLGSDIERSAPGPPIGRPFRAFTIIGLAEFPERDSGFPDGAPPAEPIPSPGVSGRIREASGGVRAAALADPTRAIGAAGQSDLERILKLLE